MTQRQSEHGKNNSTPEKNFRCDNILHRKYVPLPQKKHTMEKKEIKLQMKESVFFTKYDEMIAFLLK